MKQKSMLVAWVVALAGAMGQAWAQTPAAKTSPGDIVVRIVAADAPDRLVSDLEALASVENPNVNTIVRSTQAAQSMGDDATVWVKGARVDGTNTFERYYKGEFTYRKSELTFAEGRLKEGEHIIDPGRHVFLIDKDGNPSSTDPDIVIEGRTVSLKAYRIEMMSVDGNKAGPPETRLLGQPLNVDELRPAFTQAAAKFDASNAVNTLSHYRNFCPLRLYLPANTNELAYLLRPGDQRFRVLPGGTVELQGKPNPVIKSEGAKLVLSYRSFSAWVRTKTGLNALFGGVAIPRTDTTPAQIRVGPIGGEPMFLAAAAGLGSSFGLKLSGDMEKYPYKFMVVENIRDPMALRMMALESGDCVFERGNSATVRLQFKENTTAMKREDVRNAGPLVEALRAASTTNNPPAKDDLFGLQVRRVCKSLLSTAAKAEAEAVAKWLALPDAAERMGTMDGGLIVAGQLNALLTNSTFFNAAALADLKADDGLSKEAAGMATLDPDALQSLNRRILDLVFPGVFARPVEAARPTVRIAYAPYDPTHETSRAWTFCDAVEKWEGDALTFKTPDVPYGFYMFRVVLFGPNDKDSISPLTAEFPVCVIEPKQDGTLAFISNKGRDAFVQGELIRVEAVFRSKGARPAGNRTVVLKHPDGREDRLTVKDAGGKWFSQTVSIPESITRRLAPGRYELTATDLPPGLACYPFRFDVAPPRESLFRMIKASKYTHETYAILGSQMSGAPVDIDRAMATLADIGYNRFDYHTYSGDLHGRRGDIRAGLAQSDERLMPPDVLYLPSGRDQILNACVRYGLEYGDVLHGAGDNEIPRYIDGYINAGERWIRREVTSMRHSPAYDGQYLYEESYHRGLVGVPKKHDNFFPAWRLKRASEIFTNPVPNQIRKELSRNVADLKTGSDKWDPVAMERFLNLTRWEEHSWGDFNTRLATAGRELLPRARIGTYHCCFMFVQNGRGAVMSATDLDNGYHPDVFENLDIASCQHYHDGPTLGYWINSPIMIQLMRESPVGGRRLVWANTSMNKDPLSLSDGQMQRQMAFAMLAQGADGVSTFCMHETFPDGPNPNTIKSKETMRWLNTEILAPFGEVYSRATKPGYMKVGIVNTMAQLSMSDFKPIRTANQLEELWIACWRLGYPAVFLREGDLEKPIEGYQAIFVPGIRFRGELTTAALEQLRNAIKRGCKVIVERDSTLDAQIPDVTKMQDFDLMNYFIGPGFNVAGYDAELDKVYTLSQPCTDYLRTKMVEWGIEPAARGPFTVGPNWRDGGAIQYLIMSNYEDPDYGQACRDLMSKPVRMPLSVPAYRGEAAYDLLARTELPVVKTTNTQERSVVLDMTRVQGALAAFLPERIAALRIATRRDAAGTSLGLNGSLVGESGKAIAGVFPVRIRLLDGKGNPMYSIYRVLDSKGELELAIPLTSGRDGAMTLEVTENISGKTCSAKVESGAGTEPVLRLDDALGPYVPYPGELIKFLKSNTNAILVLGRGMEGAKAEVDRLIAGLGAKGLKVTPMNENRVWHVAAGDPSILGDPYADGFHYWAGGYGGSDGGVIEPRAVVDSPLIILSSARGSTLLNMLTDKGFVTEAPVGAAGLAVQPTIQVASRGLHWKYDTLLMVANDAEGVRSAVSRILDDAGKAGAGAPETAAKPKTYGQPEQKEGRETSGQKPAVSFMGNNEFVLDIKFDAAGNSYMITWGHGDNLYSLDPQGKLRFSRRLPEMGPCRLDMDSDRVAVFTGFGSRLYQVGLDGKPISQARLPMDPGTAHKGPTYRECYTADLFKHGLGTGGCGPLWSDLFRYAYVPGARRIVYYASLLETMRALDENFNVIAEWRGESVAGAGGEPTFAKLGEFVCSPDGTRVAQFEDETLVLREIVPGSSGRVGSARKLAQREGGGGTLSWQKGEPGPTVDRTHYGADLEVLRVDLPAPAGTVLDLGGATGLVPDGKDLRLIRTTREGTKELARLGPFPWIPTFARMSPDGRTVVLLDEYWNAFVHEVETGKRVAQVRLPEMGFTLEFTPDAKGFMVGGLRGTVMSYDMSGKPLWNTTLAAHNESLMKAEFPNVDPAIADRTDKLYETVTDEPGELDKLVTLDQSRLVNGDGEGTGGWQIDTNAGAKAAAPAYVEGGYQSKRCLSVGDALVQQQVEGLIGEHFTWVLEFFYRSASPEKNSSLMAGLAVENRHPDNVVRVLPCGKDWKFARIAMKSGGAPTALRVGFKGQGGEALVDNVTLRRIRFPSVNHMLYPPIYDVDPIVLKNPLFLKDYNPLGVLREQIPNIILSQRPAQIADALVVDAFLQNGRLNDISSYWHWSYLEDNNTQISMGIKSPRWISMVAVYFNAYDEANTPPHFDVLVSDMGEKKVVRVASVRNNRALFRLVKFPPRRADEVRVVLVNALPRQRTVTELEVYGPLSGSDSSGFVDAAGQNTYMGSFSRVEQRRLEVAPGYESKTVNGASAVPRWATPVSQVMISERSLYISRAMGFNQRLSLDGPDESFFRTGGMGFGPTPTLYGGALLKPGSDGKLWCIDPASGRSFWSVALGQRLTGSPAAIGLDVFMATDAGKLYTLDIASGAILGEQKLAGPVYGSVATDGINVYVITSGGTATCFNAKSGKALWNVEVASDTESTPAVDGGVVYLADRKGTARALQGADGKLVWTRELGSEFCRCPVVLPDLVVFGCLDGRLTALNRRTGEQVWQTQVETRFLRYDPVPMVLPPPAPAAPVSNAAAETVTAAAGPAVPVLLCLSAGKPQLIEAATGKPTERQIATGSVNREGKFEAKGGAPGIGELTAPISCYNGYLAFAAIQGDICDTPTLADSRYHNMESGFVNLLKPSNDAPPRKAGGPRPVAFAQAPVRMDAAVSTNEWGGALLSLNGPDAIFPDDRRKKGTRDDGSEAWIGFDDLSAQIYVTYDSNSLYVAAVVTDDTHVNKTESAEDIYNGDCLQIGILNSRNVHWMFGLAKTATGVVFDQADGGTNRLESVSEKSVTRAELAHTTTYRLKMPLAALGLTPGAEFGFNAVVFDDDKGGGARYRLEAAPGAWGQPPDSPRGKRYPRFVLAK